MILGSLSIAYKIHGGVVVPGSSLQRGQQATSKLVVADSNVYLEPLFLTGRELELSGAAPRHTISCLGRDLSVHLWAELAENRDTISSEASQ